MSEPKALSKAPQTTETVTDSGILFLTVFLVTFFGWGRDSPRDTRRKQSITGALLFWQGAESDSFSPHNEARPPKSRPRVRETGKECISQGLYIFEFNSQSI